MKVALVRPATIVSAREIRPIAVPPLGLAYLAGALRQAGHEPVGVDGVGEALERVTRLPQAPRVLRFGLDDDGIVARVPADAGLIAVSSMFSTEWPVTRPLVAKLRARFPRVPIVAGGEHPTSCADFVLRDCPELDAVGRGEGELLLPELADAAARGEELGRVPGVVARGGPAAAPGLGRARILDVDAIPEPAWDVLPLSCYMEQGAQAGIELGRSIPLLCSRGCPYECTFCSSPQMWGTRWKARDPEKVLAEMRRYVAQYGVSNFDVYDLTMIVKRDWIVRMARLIIDSGMAITWQLPSGTRSEVIDDEVAALLYASGCRHAIYAPESGSERMLKLIKKKIQKDRMRASVKVAARAGIVTKANFILGFPDETLGAVLANYGFAVRLALAGMNEASFFAFSPYPGSELWERLERENKVALGDELFLGLLVNTRSFADPIPDWALPPLRWLGVVLFFTAAFGRRPWRLLGLARELASRRPRTRLGAALLRIGRRTLRLRLRPLPTESLAPRP